ncbi:transposase [Rhizobium sp. IY2]|uniref:transposase n=1 Tax=Rhizobium sp. IY2 TaxID=3397853 RepID=UPI0039E07CF4
MLALWREYFHNEAAAFHVESIRWPQDPACPHCGYRAVSTSWKAWSRCLQRRTEGTERHGIMGKWLTYNQSVSKQSYRGHSR